MRTALISWIHLCRTVAADLGPYLLAALLIPGGTVVAVLWWLYRHRRAPQATPAERVAGSAVRPPASALPQTSYTPAIAKAKAWLGERYLLAHPIPPSYRSRSAALPVDSGHERANAEPA